MRDRPHSAELERMAALIQHHASASRDAGEMTLRDLDYHGISMLALVKNRVSAELKLSLQRRQKMMVANEALKLRALNELAAAFQAAGLHPLVIKGTALAYTCYEEPWHRPRTDTDLLIAHNEMDHYIDVFDALGYSRLFAIEGELVSYQATFGKSLTPQSALNIDLHWRINNRQLLASTLQYTELSERASVQPSLNLACVGAVDALLIACLHRLGHHWREERLVWIYDIYLLARSLDDSQWKTLVQRAQNKTLCSLTLDGLLQARALFDLQLPEGLETKLASAKYEASSVFLNREMPEWRLALYELRAIPGFAGKARWLKENLLPTNEYVKRQMQQDSALIAHWLRIQRGIVRLIKS